LSFEQWSMFCIHTYASMIGENFFFSIIFSLATKQKNQFAAHKSFN
jgi:hypothetical protein